jgi:hypothetical protein
VPTVNSLLIVHHLIINFVVQQPFRFYPIVGVQNYYKLKMKNNKCRINQLLLESTFSSRESIFRVQSISYICGLALIVMISRRRKNVFKNFKCQKQTDQYSHEDQSFAW